jgi:glycosyltransferase involved in cell wall biosynthesis
VVGPLAARSLRIAFLTSTRSWRGSTTVFAALAHGLAARGHRTTALVAYDRVAGAFRAQSLSVQTLPVAHTTVTAARAVRRTLRALETDIVFVDKPRDIRHAAYAAVGRPVAVVYCLSTPSPPRDLLTRLAFRRVRVAVFLTEHLAERAITAAPFLRRAARYVIPNGVDCELFRPDEAAGSVFRRRHGLGGGALLVGVGALEIQKRWDLLLDSLAQVGRTAPPLVLCGRGALEHRLQAQAQQLGVDVRFIGDVEPAQLVGAYNAATCVVHTRPDEVFSLALIEALACGRPVLAAAGGGTAELVGDAGVLAPPGDPGAFARLLQDLLRDAPRRAALASAARRRALERYTVQRMVHDYAEVLEDLG